MKSDRELVALAHENFIASFAKLAEHCVAGEHRRLGGIFAYVSGLPIALFNGCVVVEPCTPDELDTALRWVRAHAVPLRAFVAPDFEAGLASVAHAHGLERNSAPYPGMMLHPVPAAPASSPDVVVVSVDDAGIEELLSVGMGSGLPRDLAERLFSPAFLGDPDVRAFVGRLRGRPLRIRPGDPEPTGERRLQRGHAPGCPPSRRRQSVDVGRGRVGSGGGARHRSAPIVGDGPRDVRGDGLPYRRALRGLRRGCHTDWTGDARPRRARNSRSGWPSFASAIELLFAPIPVAVTA